MDVGLQATPTITPSYCNLNNNVALGTDGHGGAVYVLGSHAKFFYCTFSSNNAGRYGGAIYLQPGKLTFDHCTFSGSFAGGPLGSKDVIVWSPGALPQNIFDVTATDFTMDQWDGQ